MAPVRFYTENKRNYCSCIFDRAVKYETLTKGIFHAAKDLFDFVELGFPEKVKEFIETHTEFNVGNAFSTFRDINTTASHWRVDLAGNFSIVAAIQNNSVEAMLLWGYENVTENDLVPVIGANPSSVAN